MIPFTASDFMFCLSEIQSPNALRTSIFRMVCGALFGSWRVPKPDHSSERRFPAFPRGESNFMFLRGQHDFKIQLHLYFLQPDWLIRSFPDNLNMISCPLSLWGFVGRPWDFGSAVIPLGKQTNSN